MIFLIEGIVSGEYLFLTKDHQFEKRDLSVKEIGDLYAFSNYISATNFIRDYHRGIWNLNGNIIDANAQTGNGGHGPASLRVRAFRDRKPENALFHLEDIRQIVKKGNDSRPNRLAITYEGLPATACTDEHDDRENYAVSTGVFPANNHYFGPGASEDNNYVTNLYLQLLQGWYDHLKNMGKHIDLNHWQNEGIEPSQLQQDILRLVNQYL
ncbi:MAG: hypothetical protein LKI80_10910 [Sporolactobacillus sp.]|jgi:hypothetical protein|nr:hypothetical protein [Sporolactobacillus sp.]